MISIINPAPVNRTLSRALASGARRFRMARPDVEECRGTIPFVRGNVLFGNVLTLRDRPFETLTRIHEEHGPNVCLDMRVRSLYVLNHPDAIQHILQVNPTNYLRGRSLASDKIRDGLGEGLLTTDGNAWIDLRRRHQPPFRASRMAGYVGAVVDEATRALDRWSAFATQGTALEAFREFMRVTASAGLRVLFGYTPTLTETDKIVDAVVAGQARVWAGLFSVFDLGRFVPTAENRHYAKALTDLSTIADRIIQQAPAVGEGDNLLDALRESGTHGKLDHEALRAQIRAMLVAAPENPSNALGFALAEIARHPDVERRVREEIDTVLGNTPPCAEDLPRLVYTRQVIDETLRLYPGAWILDRWSVSEDLVAGVRVPSDRMIIMSPYFAHRNPMFWERPISFEPERFAPEQVARRPRHHYVRFGSGPRNCIGSHLALLELGILLPMFLQRYRFRVVSGPLKTAALITLRPDGLAFQLEERSTVRTTR